MKNSGFKRPQIERKPRPPLVPRDTPVRATMQVPALFRPIPKETVKAKPGKRAPTVEEKRWMDAIVEYGCVACRADGYPNGNSAAWVSVRPAVHHILRGGQRIGHRFTLPLCDPGHHQGGQQLGMTSRHPWKARFEAQYGTEDFLLRKLCAALQWSYPG
jgi:hypothetical protein